MNRKEEDKKLKKIMDEGSEYIENLLLKNGFDPDKTPLTIIIQSHLEDTWASAITQKSSNEESFRALILTFFDLCINRFENETPLFTTLFVWLKLKNKLKIFHQILNDVLSLKDGDLGDFSYVDNDSETMH